MEEKVFELLKDITTPNGYWRAGARKTQSQWEFEFPNAFAFGGRNLEWFKDVSIYIEPVSDDMPNKIVKSIFKSHKLASITYTEAAIKACIAYGEYVKVNMIKNGYKRLT